MQAIDGIRYDGFVVLPAYIDRNQHMNIGYYSVIFDQALDLPWEMLGLGSFGMGATGRSSFALENHVTYQHEVREGDRWIHVQVDRLHEKRIILMTIPPREAAAAIRTIR